MPIRKLKPLETNTNQAFIKGSAPDLGFSDVFANSFGISENLGSSLFDIGESILASEQFSSSTVLDNQTANGRFSLEGDFAFQDGEDATEDEAEIRQSRMLARREHDAIKESARRSGSFSEFADFLGGFAKGMADPVGILSGSFVGNVAAKTVGRAALQIGGKGFIARTLLKNSKHLSKSQMFMRSTFENFVGLSTLDAGTMALNRELHGEEFKSDEYIAMVLGGSVMGGALGVGMQAAGGVPNAITNSVKKRFGSQKIKGVETLTEYVNEMVNRGIKPDDSVIPRVMDIEHYSPRRTQPDYDFTPINSSVEAKARTWHVGKRVQDSSLDYDMDHGAGHIVLTDHPNLYANRIKGLNNEGDGFTYSMRLNENAKILGKSSDDVALVRNEIEKKVLSSKNLADDEKAVVIEQIRQSDNITDLSSALAASNRRIKNPDMIINKVVDDLGFDGYMTRGINAEGKDAHNAMVILQKDLLRGRGKGKPRVKFESDDTGIKARFDEEIFSEVKEDVIPDVDMEADNRILDARHRISKTVEEDINRTQDPKHSTEYDGESAKDLSPEDQQRVGLDEDGDVEANLKSALEDLENAELRADVKDGLKKELDQSQSEGLFSKMVAEFKNCLGR